MECLLGVISCIATLTNCTVVCTHVVLLIVMGTTLMSTLDCMKKVSTVSKRQLVCGANQLCFPYPGHPSISGMSCNSSSSTSITLVCSTRDAPPSSIKWYRDDTLVDINGNSTDMSVRVTNRTSSYFEIALQISDFSAGNYTCEVGNRLGNDTAVYIAEGITLVQNKHHHYPVCC